MDFMLLLWLIFLNNITPAPTRYLLEKDIKWLINVLRRHNVLESYEDILGVPESKEDLPRAEPIHPGHTLIQPSLTMLKSSVKYPQKSVDGAAVYGNLKNLGITFGKTNQRLLYTNFRKSNNLLVALLREMRNIQKNNNVQSNSPVLVIEIDPSNFNKESQHQPTDNLQEVAEIDNNASEILDGLDTYGQDIDDFQTRRKNHERKRSKHRDRDDSVEPSSSDSSSSGSSDYEKNFGNPFTVHKDKYKQNWLWNHYMDGDHMNVNPYAPMFSSVGPSGAALFFGRKWWYFNQDDYKPLS